MACPAFVKSKKFRISALIILIVLFSGVGYGLHLFNLKHSDLSKTKPEFVVSSAELFSAFDKNEAEATNKYGNKVIEVSGNIAEVAFGAADSTLSITLREPDASSGVICTFSGVQDMSQVSVKQGDNITLRGECSGMLMDVLLNNCAIVEKR